MKGAATCLTNDSNYGLLLVLFVLEFLNWNSGVTTVSVRKATEIRWPDALGE
jgi:hypothetical protein